MEPSQPIPNDKLACFLDQGRFCGPDCMAFVTVPEPSTHVDVAQVRCVLLTSVERAGRSLNILGQIANNALKYQQNRDADAKRGGPIAPPNPMGGPR